MLKEGRPRNSWTGGVEGGTAEEQLDWGVLKEGRWDGGGTVGLGVLREGHWDGEGTGLEVLKEGRWDGGGTVGDTDGVTGSWTMSDH